MIAIENRWMRTTARTLGVVCSLWWLIFSVLEGGLSVATLMEILPFGLAILVATAVAWKWEVVGGALLILQGIGYLAFTLLVVRQASPVGLILLLLFLPLPVLLAGALFIVHWRRVPPSRVREGH